MFPLHLTQSVIEIPMLDTEKKQDTEKKPPETPKPVQEIGGQKGPDPTRYGDWEKGGRCTDF